MNQRFRAASARLLARTDLEEDAFEYIRGATREYRAAPDERWNQGLRMLNLCGRRPRLCSGLGRRELLSVGSLGLFGLALPNLLRATETVRNQVAPAKARRCILLFLTGGPPQLDTWDLKPHAPADIRGELKPIDTCVTGLQISELFPLLAQRADKLCLIRSVTHGDRTHTSAGYEMLTGVPHPSANAISSTLIRPGPHDHPHFGSLVAKVRPAMEGVLPFVSLPEVIKDANVNQFPGLDGGFLGEQFSPFQIEATADRSGFRLPNIILPEDVTANRLADRRLLLEQFDRRMSRAEPSIDRLGSHYARAFEVIRSDRVRHAFDLNREPAAVRDRYGRHLFGQGCLLARRMVEAGVALTAVYWHYEGPDDSPVWDTHWNNFPHLRQRLMPPTDQAFSALLDDLSSRRMLDDTLIVCMGEFGRTPRINSFGGRDHWAAAQSIVLAGAGVRMGSVYGSTDQIGGNPSDHPVSPADVTATLLHLLGVPEDFEVIDRTGRPLRACQGNPIAGVLA